MTAPYSQLFDTSVIDSSWLPVLVPVLEEHLPAIEQQLQQLPEDGFLPAAENVFAAFRMPLPQVRVLIVGQDPYPTPGHAVGRSFATAPGVKPPRSLHNIYKELSEDVGVAPREDGDLSAWESQGVMLLNRVLTVAPGEAGSHRKLGWQAITEAAIRALNRQPMVAILWGNDAKACAKFLPDVPIINSAHPSPLSARRGFFGSRPFSRANALLRDQGAPDVDWHL